MFETPAGALLPFAEHKGFALAFACELLAGAIAGGGTLKRANQDKRTVTNGMLTFIFDPRRLTDYEWLSAEIQEITAYVTDSPPRDPEEPVLIPGDPERLMRKWRLTEGIPVDPVTWRQIVEAAATLGLDPAELSD